VHGRSKADLPSLRQTISPWFVDGGCPTRTAAALEQAELISNLPPKAETMTTPTTPSSTPAADAEVLPARKKSGPPKGWKKAKAAVGAGAAAGRGAEGEADGRVARMISVRLTRAQLAATERWRSRFDGLDQGAALRALIELGLAQRPREAIDPLGIEKATHRRVQQPKAKGSK
jgi:hypothetical protein